MNQEVSLQLCYAGPVFEVATLRRTFNDLAVLGRETHDRSFEVSHGSEVPVQTVLVLVAKGTL